MNQSKYFHQRSFLKVSNFINAMALFDNRFIIQIWEYISNQIKTMKSQWLLETWRNECEELFSRSLSQASSNVNMITRAVLLLVLACGWTCNLKRSMREISKTWLKYTLKGIKLLTSCTCMLSSLRLISSSSRWWTWNLSRLAKTKRRL